jgi:hypothetical protein
MRKIPAGLHLSGQVSAGLSRDDMPQTWRGLYHGDREYVTRMQRQWDRRQQLETKYPELAGDTRPILAHEGRYHNAPLRAGERRSTCVRQRNNDRRWADFTTLVSPSPM